MATSSRAQSYGGSARQQQHDFFAAHHSSHGANGAGRDMRGGDRDLFGRKSLDAGNGGDDRRRRVPYPPNSSALDDSDEDEDDDDRYGAPERPTARRASENLRVPRQSSSRPSSSRSSGSKMPPVPPLPSQYQPAASPRPEASPRISPTHSRNHSGSHHPPSAFHAPHPATNPPTPSRPSFPRSASRNKTSNESTSSDSDDVPLGKRIPGALTAQKSIRKKARDERDRNAVRGRSAGPGLSNAPAPDELASKLLNVQQTGLERGRTMTSSANVSRSASRHHTHGHASPNMRRLEDQLQSYQISGEPKSLQHARSVRRSEDEYSASRPNPRPRLRSLGPSSERPAVADFAPPPMPSSRSRPVSPERHYAPQGSIQTSRESNGRSLSHAPSQSRTRSRANTVSANDRNGHADDHLRRARTVRDPHGQDGKSPLLAPASGARLPTDHFAAPPLPGSPIKPGFADTEQLRIFIGDLQRFVNVEITSTTTADDVIEMVSSQGELSGRDWMLWELANEFGMERPIRDYERLSDVFTSWNKESRLNALMLKQTPLAVSLSQRYLPNSSPTFSGWVQWEMKKGKWQKRWLELREHSLFLCKKDNGKDAAFLCSLSNYDAYVMKRVTKAPKPFVFAAKSCDSIGMFQNPADAVHTFCCDSDEGKDWLEKILLARLIAMLLNSPTSYTKNAMSFSELKEPRALPTLLEPASNAALPTLLEPPTSNAAAPVATRNNL
ncbi:hypothetical protein FRC00_010871 [Tulasnella sp. 408]|nr:hypothetical protein FRC00_010871 [Tulasnella sp. 408]